MRADATPQVARIDAHLLNRAGVTRLVLLRSGAAHAALGHAGHTDPLQFGAEIYGHAGLEADLEVQDLALDCLRGAGPDDLTLDLADARIVRARCWRALRRSAAARSRQRWRRRDVAGLNEFCAGLDEASRRRAAGAAGAVWRLSPSWRADPAGCYRRSRRCAPLADLATLARHARQAAP